MRDRQTLSCSCKYCECRKMIGKVVESLKKLDSIVEQSLQHKQENEQAGQSDERQDLGFDYFRRRISDR